MSANLSADGEWLPLSVEKRIEEVCDRFEAAWKAGQSPCIAPHLQGEREPERSALLRELLFLDLAYRNRDGQLPTREEYCNGFPRDAALIDSVFDRVTAVGSPLESACPAARDSRLALGVDVLTDGRSNGPAQEAPTSRSAEATRGGVRESAAAGASLEQFTESLVESGLMIAEEIDTLMGQLPESEKPRTAKDLARLLCRRRMLTDFQARAAYLGKTKGLVLGNYVVLDAIGRGGMGRVYKAIHRRMRRTVALKVLHSAVISSKEAADRFQREVEAAAKLVHPNIVTAFDADEADGICFLAMQHVAGENLSDLVRKSGMLEVEKSLDYVLQAANGLQYAHARGVIHRDVKPSNLMLDAQGTVKILDMGLARLRREVDPEISNAASLTESGQAIGTLDYMSPEQSLDSQQADERSDIYSLGCTLHYLLTGRPVYDGSTITERILARHEAPIPSLRDVRQDVAPRLDRVFQKMVAKQTGDRYQSMQQLIADLEVCSTAPRQQVADAPPSEAKSHTGNDTRSRRRIAFGSAVAAVAFAALVVVGVIITAKRPWDSPLDAKDQPKVGPEGITNVLPTRLHFLKTASG